MIEHDAPGAAALARALELGTDTVTGLLEGLAGERVDVEVLSVAPGTHVDAVELDADPNEAIVRRAVVLVGRDTKRRFAVATSVIALGRLPEQVAERLLSGTDPIGRVLVEARVPIAREPLGWPRDGAAAAPAACSPEEVLVARRYLLVVDGRAAMVVTEWFLPAAGRAMAAAGP